MSEAFLLVDIFGKDRIGFSNRKSETISGGNEKTAATAPAIALFDQIATAKAMNGQCHR